MAAAASSEKTPRASSSAISRVVAKRIESALAQCEKTVAEEFDQDPVVRGWIRKMRENIEANWLGEVGGAPALSKGAALASEIAASRARTSVIGARSRRAAAQIVEWRSEASERLDEEMRKLAPSTEKKSKNSTNDARVDLARFATKLNASAKAVLHTAEDAPPRIEKLRKLVETVQQQQQQQQSGPRQRGLAKRKRRSSTTPRDPTDLVASHLAQNNSLADFISLPKQRRSS